MVERQTLTLIKLPFAEDVRQYKFAPLDSVKTITGKTLDIHRFIPNEELQEAMNDFVDALSLTGLSGVHDEYEIIRIFHVVDLKIMGN